ncbi:MAG: multidrug ABC transporter permease [Tenericutes bacterium HGW-Tenericutes-2]|jgi:ABC-2 type transport system permease protein|nr:MAG: multidrug ABC transporter permease [Tenericutes bacterium HGW-Tenericutes-2]
MRFAKIYGIFLKQHLKRLMEYRVDFLIGMFAFIFTQAAGLLFLFIIFQNINALAGFSIDEILLMYAISLLPRGIDHLLFDNLWLLPRTVRQGSMDRYLLRPINPLYQFIIERFQPDAFGEIFLGIALLVVTLGRLNFTLTIGNLAGLLSIVIIGTFVYTALKLLTSSTSFWLKNSYPLMQITYNISDFTKYPILIYPKFIQVLMTFIIPFALISYFPALYLLGEIDYIQVIGYLVTVTGILICLGLYVWKKGLKHYESTGS